MIKAKKSNVKVPGWYPFPGSREVERFWDGSHWTDEVRFKAAPSKLRSFSPFSFPILWKWYALCLVFITLVVVNLGKISIEQASISPNMSSSTSQAIETSPNGGLDPALSEISIPDGFVDSGYGVAFITSPSQACAVDQFGCTKVDIFAYSNCPNGVKVFGVLYAESGQEVAKTDVKSSAIKTGKKTSVLLSTSLNTASSAQAIKFVCK